MPELEAGRLVPLTNALPGEAVPYALAAGEGLRYELNGQLVTVVARPQDTGGLFGAAYISGGRGAELPFFTQRDNHQTVVVFDGLLEVWLGGTARIVSVGDEVVIPAGTPFSYRMLSNYTRFLLWSAPGTNIALFEQLGSPVDVHVHPVRARHTVSAAEFADAAAPLGIEVLDLSRPDATLEHFSDKPSGASPFILTAGEGDHYFGFDQLHTYVSRGANTDGRYFAVHSAGAKQDYIPLHFHNQHTENFFCFEGRVWIHANGREILLTKGDFVHAPAGTVHSYAFDSHHTQMIGFLSPAIFEPFFETVFEPTDDPTYTEGGEPYFNGQGFGRAQAELDLVVVGAPPQRAKALDL